MVLVYKTRAAKRELIPAVNHVDDTGRVQTVTREANARYHRLIEEFARQTGVPILLNTSFNENEPVVMSPEHAIDTFLKTKMDLLVLGNSVVNRFKDQQSSGRSADDHSAEPAALGEAGRSPAVTRRVDERDPNHDRGRGVDDAAGHYQGDHSAMPASQRAAAEGDRYRGSRSAPSRRRARRRRRASAAAPIIVGGERAKVRAVLGTPRAVTTRLSCVWRARRPDATTV
jgi:hypothetical protein